MKVERPVDYSQLAQGYGFYTRELLNNFCSPNALSAKEALVILEENMRHLFSERLCTYISSHCEVANDANEVRRFLLEQSERKQLGFSSELISQWFASGRREIYLSQESKCKLCLALGLQAEDAADFVYNCLHQTWFNYRDEVEAIYFYFICMQDLFGDETWVTAKSFIDARKNAASEADALSESFFDATGYTRVLGSELRALTNTHEITKEIALSQLSEYLDRNRSLFSSIQRSAIAVYETYLFEGDLVTTPLVKHYQNVSGFKLSTSSYLDMDDFYRDIKEKYSKYELDLDASGEYLYRDEACNTAVYDEYKKKRPLWGLLNRKFFIAQDSINRKDYDLFREEEIKLERKAVNNMLKTGVKRGNIILVLFLCFCYEHAADFKDKQKRANLFETFYTTSNYILVDLCGMFPFHPHKPFDNLFLTVLSLACKGTIKDPILYLNEYLAKYYRTELER